MNITDLNVKNLARLSCIELNDEQAQHTLTQLNGILALISPLDNINVGDEKPMVYPRCGEEPINLRLRDDMARPTATNSQRDTLMSNAPAKSDGLFLVPTVIE